MGTWPSGHSIFLLWCWIFWRSATGQYRVAPQLIWAASKSCTHFPSMAKQIFGEQTCYVWWNFPCALFLSLVSTVIFKKLKDPYYTRLISFICRQCPVSELPKSQKSLSCSELCWNTQFWKSVFCDIIKGTDTFAGGCKHRAKYAVLWKAREFGIN